MLFTILIIVVSDREILLGTQICRPWRFTVIMSSLLVLGQIAVVVAVGVGGGGGGVDVVADRFVDFFRQVVLLSLI